MTFRFFLYRVFAAVVGSAVAMMAMTASGQTAQRITAPPADLSGAAREQLLRYLNQTSSLSGEFRQVELDEDQNAVGESVGTLAFARPGRFRWEYLEPEAQLLVTDGESIWNFTPDLEMVDIRSAASLEGANPAQLLNGEADLERDFELVGTYRIENVEWFEVRPKSVASDFDLVRLGFVEGTVSMLELGAKTGRKTQIFLSEVEVNPALADTVFTFVPPTGTDVDDNR